MVHLCHCSVDLFCVKKQKSSQISCSLIDDLSILDLFWCLICFGDDWHRPSQAQAEIRACLVSYMANLPMDLPWIKGAPTKKHVGMFIHFSSC